MATTTITVTRGDTFDANVVTWQFKREGVVVAVSGYASRLVVKAKDGTTILDVDNTGASGSRTVINDADNGIFAPDCSAATMAAAAIVPGNHLYDFEVTSGAGKKTTLVTAGDFNIKEDLAQ